MLVAYAEFRTLPAMLELEDHLDFVSLDTLLSNNMEPEGPC